MTFELFGIRRTYYLRYGGGEGYASRTVGGWDQHALSRHIMQPYDAAVFDPSLAYAAKVLSSTGVMLTSGQVGEQ